MYANVLTIRRIDGVLRGRTCCRALDRLPARRSVHLAVKARLPLRFTRSIPVASQSPPSRRLPVPITTPQDDVLESCVDIVVCRFLISGLVSTVVGTLSREPKLGILGLTWTRIGVARYGGRTGLPVCDNMADPFESQRCFPGTFKV